MIRHKDETEELLLLITTNCEAGIKQTQTKPQETVQFKLTEPRETLSFKPSINQMDGWNNNFRSIQFF